MKEQDLEKLTIAEVSPRIRRREISPVQLINLYLDRIKRLNPILNAYVTVIQDQALADAKDMTITDQASYIARNNAFERAKAQLKFAKS